MSGRRSPPGDLHRGAEGDLVLERDGELYPIEIKCLSNLRRHDPRGLRAFRQTDAGAWVMTGLIIHAGHRCCRVDEHTIAVPWNATTQQ